MSSMVTSWVFTMTWAPLTLKSVLRFSIIQRVRNGCRYDPNSSMNSTLPFLRASMTGPDMLNIWTVPRDSSPMGKYGPFPSAPFPPYPCRRYTSYPFRSAESGEGASFSSILKSATLRSAALRTVRTDSFGTECSLMYLQDSLTDASSPTDDRLVPITTIPSMNERTLLHTVSPNAAATAR